MNRMKDRRPGLSKAAEVFFLKHYGPEPKAHERAIMALVGRAASLTEEFGDVGVAYSSAPNHTRVVAVMRRHCAYAKNGRAADIDEARRHTNTSGVLWSWIVVEAARVVCEHWAEIDKIALDRELAEAEALKPE